MNQDQWRKEMCTGCDCVAVDGYFTYLRHLDAVTNCYHVWFLCWTGRSVRLMLSCSVPLNVPSMYILSYFLVEGAQGGFSPFPGSIPWICRDISVTS